MHRCSAFGGAAARKTPRSKTTKAASPGGLKAAALLQQNSRVPKTLTPIKVCTCPESSPLPPLWKGARLQALAHIGASHEYVASRTLKPTPICLQPYAASWPHDLLLMLHFPATKPLAFAHADILLTPPGCHPSARYRIAFRRTDDRLKSAWFVSEQGDAFVLLECARCRSVRSRHHQPTVPAHLAQLLVAGP
jgi:hypothetical protein